MIRQEARIDKLTGNLIEFREYSNGQLTLTELYDMDGHITYKKTPTEEEIYHMGKMVERIMYRKNGSYYSKSNYLNGERVVYFENGKIEIQKTYLNGRLHGEFLKYYPDGQLEYKRNYVNGERIT